MGRREEGLQGDDGSAALPFKKAWQDEWTKPGAEGGVSAAVLGSWSYWRAQTRDLEKQSMLRVGAVTEARRDMKDLERSYLTVRKRRACPVGTPPCGALDDAPPRLEELVASGPRGRIPDEEGRTWRHPGPCGTAPVSCAIVGDCASCVASPDAQEAEWRMGGSQPEPADWGRRREVGSSHQTGHDMAAGAP